jgi:hypothetical protein
LKGIVFFSRSLEAAKRAAQRKKNNNLKSIAMKTNSYKNSIFTLIKNDIR